MDLDRPYVINGDDLRIALSGGKDAPVTASPREMAEYVLRAALVPDVVIVSRGQLARALDGMTVWCKPDDGQDPGHTFAGKITNPEVVARRVLDLIARPDPWAPDDEVVDAHICCDHAPGDAELAAMAALLPALPLVSKLGYDARERVMDWAKHRACDGQAPF